MYSIIAINPRSCKEMGQWFGRTAPECLLQDDAGHNVQHLYIEMVHSTSPRSLWELLRQTPHNPINISSGRTEDSTESHQCPQWLPRPVTELIYDQSSEAPWEPLSPSALKRDGKWVQLITMSKGADNSQTKQIGLYWWCSRFSLLSSELASAGTH